MSNDPKKTQPAAENLDDKIANAVEKAMEKVLPSAMLASSEVASRAISQALTPKGQSQEDKEAAIKAEMEKKETCTDCGQKVAGCKKKHAKMYVGPKNLRRFKSFPGLFLNGVQYISTHPSQLVTVPADNNFEHQIALWEQSEEDMAAGRSIDHNSGVISMNNQSGYKPFGGAGFSQ